MTIDEMTSDQIKFLESAIKSRCSENCYACPLTLNKEYKYYGCITQGKLSTMFSNDVDINSITVVKAKKAYKKEVLKHLLEKVCLMTI